MAEIETRRRRGLSGLLTLLLVVVPTAACGSEDVSEDRKGRWLGPIELIPPSFELGGEAPDFELRVLGAADDAEARRLRDLRGEVVLLDFWGAWCSGCIKEHSMLVELAQTYSGRGVRFFGVTSDSPDQVAEFEALRGEFSYPILKDDGSVAAAYGIVGWPTKAVIDRDGALMWWRPGGPLPRELIVEALDAVLAGERPNAGPRAAFAEPKPDSLSQP